MHQESDNTFISQINITPLVDVLLVLLVILIISAPYMSTEGVNLTLPTTIATKELNTQPENATISITSKGVIFLDGKKILLSALADILRPYAQKENFTLFFEADKAVSYDIVAKVLAKIQEAGIADIGLVTLPE